MKINSLHIRNFRAIREVILDDLPETVVIAGPNGCGKSCIFDAIRLLKSAYGGYEPNEWNQWFGEFQINLDDPASMLPMFQDPSAPLSIAATFTLSDGERAYLKECQSDLVSAYVRAMHGLGSVRRMNQMSMAQQVRLLLPESKRNADAITREMNDELDRPYLEARITFAPYKQGEIDTCSTLESIFTVYKPQHIGIIDYHGPNRNYVRERVDSVNLSIDATEQSLRNNALYDHNNKYSTIKTELVSEYVRQIISAKAEERELDDSGLMATLQDLFATFLPGKRFLGPRPTEDGKVLFKVETPSGKTHDIDDLSSGEKEVLYGYLRIRRASPRNSVLLIDEPELHLNPRLVMGLASFYHRQLGAALGSQLWLVTHSDTLIRESVGQPGFAVYHMQPCDRDDVSNQVSAVRVGEEFDRTVVDLVGDLAAYRPGQRIVIFEGGGGTDFDVQMVSRLFPAFAAQVNLISGGGKRRVADVYALLDELRARGKVQDRICAVMDRDSGTDARLGTGQYTWDVYHIENYLLEPVFIAGVLNDLNVLVGGTWTAERVDDELRAIGMQSIGPVVADGLTTFVNRQLIGALKFRVNPRSDAVARDLAEAVNRSVEQFNHVASGLLKGDVLPEKETELTALAADFSAVPWHKGIRGRDVLKALVGKHGGGIAYEAFRNLIIARMCAQDFQPPGMKAVLDAVLQHE